MKAYLEHFGEQGGPVDRVEIARSPFVIGRSRSADLTIYSAKVSKEHAQIARTDDGFHVRDLGSTNGTFVNGKRVEQSRLTDGDIIHVAHWEFGFCLNSEFRRAPGPTVSMTEQTDPHARESLIRLSNFLHQLVSDRSVTILFQSIVDLESGAVIGYEALGRGRHQELHQSPAQLFRLAEKCRMERVLCRLFRNRAIEISTILPTDGRLFINIHASEFTRPDFFEVLEELGRINLARRRLVIEVSEQSVTSLQQLRAIKCRLGELNIEFAYDDFGSGQARLLELVECPPHFLKLDRSLVQGMESSTASRELVRALLAAIAGTGIQVIAEGIETEATARLCRESGCHLGQGYFFSPPAALLDVLANLGRPDLRAASGSGSV